MLVLRVDITLRLRGVVLLLRVDFEAHVPCELWEVPQENFVKVGVDFGRLEPDFHAVQFLAPDVEEKEGEDRVGAVDSGPLPLELRFGDEEGVDDEVYAPRGLQEAAEVLEFDNLTLEHLLKDSKVLEEHHLVLYLRLLHREEPGFEALEDVFR